MSFFDDHKVDITFRVDPKRAENFTRALEILGKDKNEAFEEFLAMLISEALNPNREDEGYVRDRRRLSEKSIRMRINKWANSPDSHPYRMIRAFFKACPPRSGWFNEENEHVDRYKIQIQFNELCGFEDVSKTFITVFRQMCSNAIRAYGDIFIYDRRKEEVCLNPLYEEQILSLKDKFLE